MAVWRAKELGVGNFSLLVSHVTVPPAMRAILGAAGNRVEAFLAAGHVCTVMGWEEYLPLALEYRVPIVVTGFEPMDLLEGILMAVEQLEEGRHEVENQYVRSVQEGGNRPARELMERVFQVVDREWRGVGSIPGSGLLSAGEPQGVRRGGEVLLGPDPGSGGDGMPGRGGASGPSETHGVSRLRHPMHARISPGRPHGLLGGGLRRVLSIGADDRTGRSTHDPRDKPRRGRIRPGADLPHT